MEKKHKIFIFIAHGIKLIGGMEMVTAGMAKYLESLGWKVYIFSPESSKGKTAIPSLNPYLKIGGDCTFLWTPTYKFKRYEQEQNLNFMLRKLNLPNINDCEIIIQSCSTPRAFWAELLAAKLNARHFFIASEETYRGNLEHYYEENLDFFYFKLQRNEIIPSNITMLTKLFNGYKNVTNTLYEMPLFIREQDPVQDVDFPTLNKIQKLDWNICHIGRANKDYFPYVVKGVAEFARRHPDKSINFIFVGDITAKQNFIINSFQGIKNVTLLALGDLVPIPRSLFSKIDVILAMAGSASYISQEGVFLINGSAKNPERTPGVLGYDTKNTIYGDGTFSYVEALENVLVKKLYDKSKFDYPKKNPAEWYYNNFWTIVKNAAPEKEYYVKRLSQERIRDWTAIFPFGTISKGARIILFGATEIAKDYKKQIESQQNSQIEIGRGYIKQIYNTPPIMK